MTITPIGGLVAEEFPVSLVSVKAARLVGARIVRLIDGRHKLDKGDWVAYDGKFFKVQAIDLTNKLVDPPIVVMTLTLEPK